MTYSVVFNPNSERILNKLPKEDALRIIKKFKQIKVNPFRYLEHFEGNNYFKLRIGIFRALIEVDNGKRILFVRILDKRSRIHKE